MSGRSYHCHKCKNSFELEVKLGRRDECPHCSADLHCCKNCKYYEVSAHNQCTEHVSEYVPEKEKANFCTTFFYREGQSAEDPDILLARAKLDALFKK